MDDNRKRLIGALIGLARATEGNEHLITPSVNAVVSDSLTAEDPEAVGVCLKRVEEEKRKMVPDCFYCASPCGRTSDYDLNGLASAEPAVRALKEQLLADLCHIAPEVKNGDCLPLYRALIAVGIDDFTVEELMPIADALHSIA